MNRLSPSCLSSFLLIAAAAACATPSTAWAQSSDVEFSNDVKALPFPPDARKLDFDTTFKDVEFVSRSPLTALALFYREQMAARGWQEDTSAASIEDDEIELTFQHGSAEVTVELDEGSDGEVDVTLDCDGLDWEGADDPAALARAGVPQPQSHLFLQRELPRPEDVSEVEYDGDACKFKCKLDFPEAAAYYASALSKQGWREVAGDRFLGKYIHRRAYRRGPLTLEVSANKNHQGVGSRITVAYASSQAERVGASLAAVGPLPEQPSASAAGDSPAGGRPAARAKRPVQVANNSGTATVTLGARKFVLKHAAAYQTKYYGDEQTVLLFSDKPIPMQKLQQLLATEDDFFFSDLFEFDIPSFIEITVREDSVSLSFSSSGIGIGRGMENAARDLQQTDGRVRGTIRMTKPDEVFDKPFLVEASIDAGLMTAETRLAGSAAGPAPVESALSDKHGLPVPKAAHEIQAGASQYRKYVDAKVDMKLADVVAMYRREMPARQWSEDRSAARVGDASASLAFSNSGRSMTLQLRQRGTQTDVMLASRDADAARRDGMLPEPGKARLVMGNAHTRDIVISIGKTNYTVRAGRGARDPKQALNYSVAPGKYTFTIKIPGQAPQTESVEIPAGATWGILGLPTGGYFSEQLY